VHPSFGRLDASSSPILINDGKLNFKYLPPYQSGIFTQGAIRDIKSIKIQNAKAILMARNNDSPLIYTVK
jgi:ribosomal protein L30E